MWLPSVCCMVTRWLWRGYGDQFHDVPTRYITENGGRRPPVMSRLCGRVPRLTKWPAIYGNRGEHTDNRGQGQGWALAGPSTTSVPRPHLGRR